MTVFEQVAEFHRAFSVEIFDTQTIPNQALQEFRINLLTEEYNELITAYNEKDIVEVADALADITYIICGTAHSYGIALDNGWEPPYVEVCESSALENQFEGPYDPEVEMHMTMLNLLFEAYLRYEKHKHMDGIRDSMFSMMMEICYISSLIGIPFKAIFDEVHRSNMAKLMPDGSVLRREDGKIIKPQGWSPPDIKSILYPSA